MLEAHPYNIWVLASTPFVLAHVDLTWLVSMCFTLICISASQYIVKRAFTLFSSFKHVLEHPEQTFSSTRDSLTLLCHEGLIYRLDILINR